MKKQLTVFGQFKDKSEWGQDDLFSGLRKEILKSLENGDILITIENVEYILED